MRIPGLGEVQKDEALGWYFGPAMPIPVLGGAQCCIVVDGYDEDRRPEDFHVAIANFLTIGPEVLKRAEPFLYRYYQDCARHGDATATIASPADVWRHLHFGDEPQVKRRAHGDKGIYVSLSCRCDWEQEHGLELVFKNGLTVNKVGPFDGHATNADAYAEPGFEDVVYVDRETLERRRAARKTKAKTDQKKTDEKKTGSPRPAVKAPARALKVKPAKKQAPPKPVKKPAPKKPALKKPAPKKPVKKPAPKKPAKTAAKRRR
jgi:hypothetical protein